MKLLRESWEILQEDDKPVKVHLTDRDLSNPDKIDLKQNVKDAQMQAATEEAQRAAEERTQKAQDKYADLLKHVKEVGIEDALDSLSEALVPVSGVADTVAGELVRAIERIMYRSYNDGDLFYEGYGLETSGGSAEYLMDFDGLNVRKAFTNIIDNQYTDDEYNKALKNIAQTIVDFIVNHPELLVEPNKVDSRRYDTTFLEENQPTYDYFLEFPDTVRAYIKAGHISTEDVREEVENWLYYENVFFGAEVYDYTDGLNIDNLTRDGLDEIQYWDESPNLWSTYIDELEAKYGKLEESVSKDSYRGK